MPPVLRPLWFEELAPEVARAAAREDDEEAAALAWEAALEASTLAEPDVGDGVWVDVMIIVD